MNINQNMSKNASLLRSRKAFSLAMSRGGIVCFCSLCDDFGSSADRTGDDIPIDPRSWMVLNFALIFRTVEKLQPALWFAVFVFAVEAVYEFVVLVEVAESVPADEPDDEPESGYSRGDEDPGHSSPTTSPYFGQIHRVTKADPRLSNLHSSLAFPLYGCLILHLLHQTPAPTSCKLGGVHSFPITLLFLRRHVLCDDLRLCSSSLTNALPVACVLSAVIVRDLAGAH
jgi:hypothetical protein